MASIPEPVAEQPVQLPDAVNAAPPAHVLRALEWRTGLEYLAALRAARRIADWPRGDGHPVLVRPQRGNAVGDRRPSRPTGRLLAAVPALAGRDAYQPASWASVTPNTTRVARVREMSARKIVLLQAVNGVRKTFPVNPIDRLSIARVIWAAT
jgi:hypothetical protein